MNNEDICIIVQGPSDNIKRHRDCWKNHNLIFSTWINDIKRDKYTKEDTVIFSKLPRVFGHHNINLQKISTLNGLYIAKNLGFNKCIKLRSDLYATNPDKLIDIINFDKLNFIGKHCYKKIDNFDCYMIDYMQCGPIDMMIKLWEIDDINFSKVPEISLLNNFNKYFTNKDLHFLLKYINKNNDLWWNRPRMQKYISTLNKDITYKSE